MNTWYNKKQSGKKTKIESIMNYSDFDTNNDARRAVEWMEHIVTRM